jgi:hypothetical protein
LCPKESERLQENEEDVMRMSDAEVREDAMKEVAKGLEKGRDELTESPSLTRMKNERLMSKSPVSALPFPKFITMSRRKQSKFQTIHIN